MPGFQQFVNLYPAPGVWGARASNNPTAVVDAGPFNLTSGASGVTVGKMAWQQLTAATGKSVVNNFSPTAPVIPDGIIGNEQQVLITAWLAQYGLVVPAGYPVTIYNRGDFWAKAVYGPVAIGNKVFANLFSGDVLGAAAGSFPTNAVGSSAVVVATTTLGTPYLMTITSTTSGSLQIGQQITGPGLTGGLFYVDSFGTYNGSTGTINLSAPVQAASTGGTFTSIANVGIGGAVVSSATINSGTNILTIVTQTSGIVAVGQLIQCATVGLPAGAYVASLGTYNGTSGTVNIGPSNATATITTQPFNFSAWIETPWYFNSAGNTGDLVKIGSRW
jgi:hypothetical protein